MNRPSSTEIFFDLLRHAIGASQEFSHTPSVKEWNEIFEIAAKHTLSGITYSGIEKLPKEQHPPKDLYIKWHICALQIKKINEQSNIVASKISNKFRDVGFRNSIIKGQGIALLYPQPQYRQAGDIDIWLEGDRDHIVRYLQKIATPNEPVCYHHTDFPINPDISIEVHFMPSWMNNPFTNRKLQKFFDECSHREFENKTNLDSSGNAAYVSTLEFNRIFILLHIYRHIFAEGIGLRQLLDYYMVLNSGFTQEEKEETTRTIKQLNMFGFARAVMYVLWKVFDLKKEFMIVPPDANQGEFLLKEIMKSGNFGKFGDYYTNMTSDNMVTRVMSKLQHTMRLFKFHPAETLYTPLFKTWHYFWRKYKNKYYKSNKFIMS